MADSVASQTAYAVIMPGQRLVVSSQTAYAVLIAPETSGGSSSRQGGMGLHLGVCL